MAHNRRVNILGVGVSAIAMPDALEIIESWISRRGHHYVCVANVHGIMESQHDEDLRRTYNVAGLVTPDGMPLVWVSRLRGYPNVRRVYGPDLMLSVCERSVSKQCTHFLYGGEEGVAQKLRLRLEEQFPGLRIVGSHTPPFRKHTAREDEEVVREINDTKPDIVWVGLGTPKQEHWMAAHVDQLTAPVLIGVGAAFDFLAGTKRQAPVWMQKAGLEWSFRLLSEPRRLWRRYLLYNPQFTLLVLLQTLGIKPYSGSEGAI